MNPELNLFIKTLKQNKCFATKPRIDLFKELQKHSSPTIAELIKGLKSQDQVTVYRNLKLFEKLNIITVLQLGWNSRIELSDRFHHHHHHLSCTNCGKIVILKESPDLEKIIEQLSARSGFKASDHQLEIRGLCQGCQEKGV